MLIWLILGSSCLTIAWHSVGVDSANKLLQKMTNVYVCIEFDVGRRGNSNGISFATKN